MTGKAREAPEAGPISPLKIALVAMLLQQTCATLGRAVIPLIAPAIVADLVISPALVGVFLSLSSAAGFVSTLICGGFILRYGALRMTQVGMVFLGGGLALSASGWVGSFVPGGFASGLGQAVSTPSSSHLLGRFAPPHLAPLIFSLKQTGVPAGLMLAGLIAPALVEAYGWQVAILVAAAICTGTAVALQPLRARFDTDRNPAQPLTPAAIRGNIVSVLRQPALRLLCFTMFSFVGLQALFTGFFVLYLVQGLGNDLARAGLVFSIAVAVAVPARIGWGWVGSRLMRPDRLLALLGIAMSAAAALTAAMQGGWPIWLLALSASLFSATAVSWHGVLLAEVARLSPPGRIGATTGVVLSFGDAGSLVLPLLFSAALALADSYRIGYLIGGLPTLVVGLYSLRLVLRSAGPAHAHSEPSSLTSRKERN